MTIGIIFDCDGTLVDSERAHFISWQRALAPHHISFTEEECYLYSGFSGLYITQKICEKHNIAEGERLFADKRRHYHEIQHQGLAPIDKTLDFVKKLADQKTRLNLKFAVASAAHKEEILHHLARLEIEEIFEAVVSGSDDLSAYNDPEGVNKPKPYIYLHTAQLLGLDPRHCIAFEDSGPGVISATSAGLTTYAVPNSFTKGHDFSKAHHVIPLHSSINFDHFLQKIETLRH